MTKSLVDKLVLEKGTVKEYKGPDGKMYWSIKVEFKPLEINGEKVSPITIGCGDLELDIKNWKELEGLEIYKDKSFFDEGPDASFYVYEHSRLNELKVEFIKRNGKTFQIEWDSSVDFLGGFKDDFSDADSDLKIKFKAEVEYVE